MRVLLSTIGSRGDVQPLVALGLALRDEGAEVRMCVPPDFRAWIETLGLDVAPIGPPLRSTATAAAVLPTPAQIQQMMAHTVATQFETITDAARGCDLIVGATALQIAAPSIAESLGVPYVFAAYCPAVLPSPRHAPPVLALLGDTAAPTADDHGALWEQDAQRWNAQWRDLLNAQRTARGLEAVDNVRDHVLTATPWLAADGVLAPWPGPDDVVQPGAWILPDERPLAREVESFLDAGAPPIYVGFGSMRAPEGLGRVVVEAARAVGRRLIVSRGWAELDVVDDEALVVDEVNHHRLFPRVAAVVHHGGAGTTTAAARAGVPQVVVPQVYDQHYWAKRVDELGIGVAHAPGAPTTVSLGSALERALTSDVAARARAIVVRADGAQVAARRLVRV